MLTYKLRWLVRWSFELSVEIVLYVWVVEGKESAENEKVAKINFTCVFRLLEGITSNMNG